MRKILFEVNQYSYLDSLKKFEVRKLQDNATKVLQMKYEAEISVLSKMIYEWYKAQVYLLYHTKGLTLEEKKLKLVDWVDKAKERFPDRFSKIGWYDLQSMRVVE
jgi:hypothetical protein